MGSQYRSSNGLLQLPAAGHWQISPALDSQEPTPPWFHYSVRSRTTILCQISKWLCTAKYDSHHVTNTHQEHHTIIYLDISLNPAPSIRPPRKSQCEEFFVPPPLPELEHHATRHRYLAFLAFDMVWFERYTPVHIQFWCSESAIDRPTTVMVFLEVTKTPRDLFRNLLLNMYS